MFVIRSIHRSITPCCYRRDATWWRQQKDTTKYKLVKPYRMKCCSSSSNINSNNNNSNNKNDKNKNNNNKNKNKNNNNNNISYIIAKSTICEQSKDERTSPRIWQTAPFNAPEASRCIRPSFGFSWGTPFSVRVEVLESANQTPSTSNRTIIWSLFLRTFL